MADKLYQVFVSSTFTDLRVERQQVLMSLLQMDCIPAGMELFPASDEHWDFIRRVIDDCDYYLVFVAGRYGSTTSQGVSFTEREFDYALQAGIPILAFLHQDPDSIPIGQSDLDPELRNRLSRFRERLSDGRLVKYWRSGADLTAQVILSMTAAIKTHPRPGWVRGGGPAPVELLQEINSLRREKEGLQEQLEGAKRAAQSALPELAPLTSEIRIRGHYKTDSHHMYKRPWEIRVSWRELVGAIGPDLLNWSNESIVQDELPVSLLRLRGEYTPNPIISPEIFKTIKVQLLALALIDIQPLNTRSGGVGMFWRLTTRGKDVLLQERTLKKDSTDTMGKNVPNPDPAPDV